MARFRDISIRRKLNVIIMYTAGIALFLAGMGFVAYELVTFRRTAVRNATILADIVAVNLTAALQFNEPAAVQETLRPLREEPHIVSVEVYTSNGKLFTRYVRDGQGKDSPVPALSPVGHYFSPNRLVVF